MKRHEEVMPGGTDVALVLDEGMTEAEWEAVGEKLGRAHRASGWWIGDWINYGERAGFVSREKYERAEELTGLTRGTLRTYAWVARAYELSSRDDSLTFKAHRLALGSRNGNAPEEPVAFEIRNGRDRQIAAKSKERVERAVGACNALVRGAEVLQIEAAIAVSTDQERDDWKAAFADARRALKRMGERLDHATAKA